MPVFPAAYDPSIFVSGTGGNAVHTRTINDYGANPSTQQFFPSPPPYSEVMAKPEVWPPSKDELPPYPGEPVVSANQATSLPQNAVGGEPFVSDTCTVPGLPPYSSINPSAAESAAPIASGNIGNTASCAVGDTAAAVPVTGASDATVTRNTTMDSCTNPPSTRSTSEESTNTRNQRNVELGHEASSCVPDVHN